LNGKPETAVKSFGSIRKQTFQHGGIGKVVFTAFCLLFFYFNLNLVEENH
jgi:hypothetical protein